MGYHYEPLDYLCSQITIGSASAPLVLTNGVAVGLYGATGFIPQGGGIICQGRPDAMNRLVWYPSVQEQPLRLNNISTVGSAVFNLSSGGGSGGYTPKIVTLSFTDFPMLGFRQYLLGSQCYAYFYPVVTLSDCSLRGVNLSVAAPSYGPDANPAASVTLKNNLMERGTLSLFSGVVSYYSQNYQMPLGVSLYNNLFWSNTVSLTYADANSYNHPAWTIKDNVHDGVSNTFTGTGSYASYIVNSYDAFRNTPNPLAGPNHVTLTALTYATGPLGKWYINQASSASTPNTALENVGSRTAATAGLYHHTIKTGTTKEASTQVDIGFHYLALDANNNFLDTDGDGLADYIEDSNGNGGYNSGDAGDFVNVDSDGDGLPDNYELTTTLTSPTATSTGNTGVSVSDGYKDPDGDGLTNLEEMKLGKNPLVPDVAAPNFTPVGGDFSSSQNVVVNCPTAVVTIRYTLDGSEPNITTPDIVVSGNSVTVSSSQTLKAKAWKTSWTTSDTESQGYRINEAQNNNPPTLTVSPSGSISLPASESIEILVEAADTDGAITKVQLYRDNYNVAESTTSPLRYTIANIPAGTYIFKAKAIDNLGAVTISAPITITIAASVPVVSLVGAQPFYTSNPSRLLANITGVNPTALTTLTLNSVAIPKRTGEFAINAMLVEGANTFTLVVNGTAQGSTTVYLDSIAPVVAITSPANNATFSTTRVNVSGTLTETSLKQIMVNGVLAFINVGANTFTALNVPLATGANAVIATAEDIAGNTKTATINITGGTTLVDPVQLAADIVGGFASLSVNFTPTATVPGTILQVDYDFDGNGTTDQSVTSAPFLNAVSHSYGAGEFFPVVTVQTTAGKFSSLGGWNSTTADRLRINVQVAPQQVGSAISITDPVDLKVTADGHLYILSRSTATIFEYDATPAPIRSVTIAGTTPTPTGLDVDANGNVYVAISALNQVAKYKHASGTGNLELDTSFGTGGFIGSAGTGDGQFNTPYDVAVSPDGQEIVVSDSGNHRIQRFSVPYFGFFVGTFGSLGSGAGQFNTPKGLTYDNTGYLYIVDSGNNRVVLTTSSSTLGTSGSTGTALGQFQGAVNLCVNPRGIYVGETGNNRVQIFEPIRNINGFSPTPFNARLELSGQFSTPLNQPYSVAPIRDLLVERMYIADTGNNRVIKAAVPETNSPDDAWTTMKNSIVINGNIDGAVSQFSTSSGGSYREAFLSIGMTKLQTDLNAVGTLTPVFIKGDKAQYYFERTISGEPVLFTVEFVKENDKWKISSF